MNFDKLVESIMENADKKMHKCDDCGKIHKDVKRVNCPYAEEIHNTKIKVNLCDDCYRERANDI